MNLEGRQTGAPLWRSELDARTRLSENVKERKQLGCVSGQPQLVVERGSQRTTEHSHAAVVKSAVFFAEGKMLA